MELWMKFEARASTGKAGEYYLAYWITKNFNWPCRLLDIDVGIDAQIEIFDDLNHSVGDFIAVQIKATTEKDPSVPVKLRNLEYWESIEDPMILISITLSEEVPKIYWKQINDKKIQSYISSARLNKSKTTTIRFDSSNLLEPESKEIISKLPYKDKINIINDFISKAQESCNEITGDFWSEHNEDYSFNNVEGFDYLSIDYYIGLFESACIYRDDIRKIIKEMPKIESLAEGLDEMEETFTLAYDVIYKLIDGVSEFDCDHDFERSKQWMRSESHITIVKMFEETHKFI
jgi:hypothetical protein